MKRNNYCLFVVIILLITNISFTDNAYAQKKYYDNNKSKRSYYDHKNSTSSKSSAVIVDHHREKRQINKYFDYYESNRRVNRDTRSNKKDNSTFRSENSENYFRIDKSKNSLWDGKHWEESKYPLNVYIKEVSSRLYKSNYKDYVKYALDVWRKADDRIQYRFVKSIDDADIAVIFVENLGDEYEEDYLGITNYDINKNKLINFSKIEISLIKNGNERVSAGEIKATIIHEIGHALGLGHSQNENDLMYPYISTEHSPDLTYDELSRGDKLAIKDLIDLSFKQNYVWK